MNEEREAAAIKKLSTEKKRVAIANKLARTVMALPGYTVGVANHGGEPVIVIRHLQREVRVRLAADDVHVNHNGDSTTLRKVNKLLVQAFE